MTKRFLHPSNVRNLSYLLQILQSTTVPTFLPVALVVFRICKSISLVKQNPRNNQNNLIVFQGPRDFISLSRNVFKYPPHRLKLANLFRTPTLSSRGSCSQYYNCKIFLRRIFCAKCKFVPLHLPPFAILQNKTQATDN